MEYSDCIPSNQGAIFRPRADEIHWVGSTLNVWWYIGRPSDTRDQFFFSVFLRPAKAGAYNITILSIKPYDVFSPEVVEFTECADYRIEETLLIPPDLQVTDPLFEVGVSCVNCDLLGSWRSADEVQTGSSFTILAATSNPPSSSSSSTTTSPQNPAQASIADPTNEPTVDQVDVTSKASTDLATGTMAGIGVGAVALVALFGFAIWFSLPRRERLQKQEKARTEPREQQEKDGPDRPNPKRKGFSVSKSELQYLRALVRNHLRPKQPPSTRRSCMPPPETLEGDIHEME